MSRNDIRIAVVNGRSKAVREIYSHIRYTFPYKGMKIKEHGFLIGTTIETRNWTLYIYRTQHMEGIHEDSGHGEWLFAYGDTLTKGFGLPDLKETMKDIIWW